MYYTYLTKSTKKNWVYIGSSKDLKNRFSEHNHGKVQSTKPYIPFDLVYYEAYPTYNLARKREIELKKSGQQKEILYSRLNINNRNLGEVA